MDIILFPVNWTNIHWALTAVDMGARTIHYYDSFPWSDNRRSRIQALLLDIACFVFDDAKERLGQDWTNDGVWGGMLMWGGADGVPQQGNFFDCGMYAMHFTERLCSGQPGWGGLQPAEVPQLRARLALDIFGSS